MKKVGKIAIIALSALLCALIVFTLVTFVIHSVKTDRELEALKAGGFYNPVSVGDYSLNVAAFGKKDGEHTIVALAGLGMADFAVSMRPMTACLEENNLVVFVDRAGYGLSEDTGEDMTLDRIVEDYRHALQNAGIEGPYVLMPHSIGGAYATYWCSKYPEEIEAVAFVDGSQLDATAFEEERDEYRTTFVNRVETLLCKLGFGRYVLRDYFYQYPDIYTEEEQYLGDALTVMSIDSWACLSECDFIADNVQSAFNSIVTNDVPKLYICASWGYETEDDVTEYIAWMNRQREINDLGDPITVSSESIERLLTESCRMRETALVPYLEKMGNCELVCLGGDHMIYEQKPEECGRLIFDFINSLGE